MFKFIYHKYLLRKIFTDREKRNVLIVGEIGSGKTLLIKDMICTCSKHELKSKIFSVRGEYNGQYGYGQIYPNKKFDDLNKDIEIDLECFLIDRQKKETILIIDEIESALNIDKNKSNEILKMINNYAIGDIENKVIISTRLLSHLPDEFINNFDIAIVSKNHISKADMFRIRCCKNISQLFYFELDKKFKPFITRGIK